MNGDSDPSRGRLSRPRYLSPISVTDIMAPMYCKSRRLPLPILLLFLVLLAGLAPKPAALPEGVSPLPAASAQHMQTLLEAAEKYRGLHARLPIPAGTLEEAGLKKKLLESMRQHMPEAELRAAEVSLKAFGLIPESMSLSKYLPELLTSQVA